MNYEKISILFVEDDETERERVFEFLKSKLFKDVFVAQNGKDGLEKYKKHNPDIVLTDLTMPIMDGLEMSQAIKNINEEVPILLITSHFEKSITEVAVDIGVDGYLFKPLSLSRVDKILQKYAQRVVLKREFSNEHKLLEQYKGVIDISASVTKTDADGVITYVNDSFCNMSGYERDELIGKNHSIVKHPDTDPLIHKKLWQTILDKKTWHGRVKNLRKNRESYHESLVIVPILNSDDKIEEFIALKHDITELWAQKEELKKQVKKEVEKNIELHKEREKERLLEEKFSVIGKMAAGITHEINTPLTYVKGNLELMMYDIEDLDDSIKQKEYLRDGGKILLDGVNRMASIVESMREMASQARGKPQEENIYSSMITALTLSFSKASNITIQGEFFKIGMNKDKHNIMAQVQKQRIEQVFIIIINNAIDALKTNKIFDERLIEISLKDDDKHVLVSFQDNGGGIKDEILPKIFDPFQSSKVEGGIGIGLNVAKRIMEDHGGTITAKNINKGACFEVQIPKKSKFQIDE